MYLFQRISSLDAWHALANLHSTMYLFQHASDIADFVRDNYIYIPLCIYFNKFCHCAPDQMNRFTFHYVSISTDYRKCVECGLPNLHSTMYLFQPPVLAISLVVPILFTFHYVSISTKFRTLMFRNIIIYIPLCIYFNPKDSIVKIAVIVIYIPLCIYFNSCSTVF